MIVKLPSNDSSFLETFTVHLFLGAVGQESQGSTDKFPQNALSILDALTLFIATLRRRIVDKSFFLAI